MVNNEPVECAIACKGREGYRVRQVEMKDSAVELRSLRRLQIAKRPGNHKL